jgi:hypothetical protein
MVHAQPYGTTLHIMARTLPDPFQRPLNRLPTELILSFGLFEFVDSFSPCFLTFVDFKGGPYASPSA